MTTRTRPDEERVWLQAMISALGGLATIDAPKVPGEHMPTDWAAVNRDLAHDAAEMADNAITEWRQRYPDPDAVPAPAADPESGL